MNKLNMSFKVLAEIHALTDSKERIEKFAHKVTDICQTDEETSIFVKIWAE